MKNVTDFYFLFGHVCTWSLEEFDLYRYCSTFSSAVESSGIKILMVLMVHLYDYMINFQRVLLAIDQSQITSMVHLTIDYSDYSEQSRLMERIGLK